MIPTHVSRYLSCQSVLELDIESPHSSGVLFTSVAHTLGFDLNANRGDHPTVCKEANKHLFRKCGTTISSILYNRWNLKRRAN